MGWPSAQVAAAIVLVAASAARAKLICDGSAFRPPSLSGAEFTRINALPVAKWKVNATWPETRLYPDDGMDICNVTLTYRHADQKDTILVQVLLPDNWNGKFAAAGGGGFAAGKLDGEPMASLLALRYASESPWTAVGVLHSGLEARSYEN